jgi:hypothetical protein
MREWTDLSTVLTWMDKHSGTISMISLALALLGALFKPSTWRKVVASGFAALAGIGFLPYDPSNWKLWSVKACALALVFICGYWWLVEKCHSWRAGRRSSATQPSGTFETIVETVGRIPGDSNVRVQLSTDQETLTITKRPVDKK